MKKPTCWAVLHVNQAKAHMLSVEFDKNTALQRREECLDGFKAQGVWVERDTIHEGRYNLYEETIDIDYPGKPIGYLALIKWEFVGWEK